MEEDVKKFVEALTQYICGKAENLKDDGYCKKLFSNGANEQGISKVWTTFFTIAKKNEQNFVEICENFNEYIAPETNRFDFENLPNRQIHVATYEGYLKTVLIEIDNKVYTYTNASFSSDGQMVGYCIGQFSNRAEVEIFEKGKAKAIDFSSAIKRLRDAQEKRNKLAHPGRGQHDYREAMEYYIKAFFAATILYTYLHNIGAHVKFTSFTNNSTFTIKYKEKIIQSKQRGKDCFVPIPKELFGNERRVTVTVKVSAADYQTFEEEFSIKRGNFFTKSSLAIIKLVKQKKPGDDGPLPPPPPPPPRDKPKSANHKWLVAGIATITAILLLLLGASLLRNTSTSKTAHQQEMLETMPDLKGYYVFGKDNGNGQLSTVQSAVVTYNAPLYILWVMEDNNEQYHKFRVGTGNQLESETLGTGTVAEQENDIIITFTKGQESWILKRTGK